MWNYFVKELDIYIIFNLQEFKKNIDLECRLNSEILCCLLVALRS